MNRNVACLTFMFTHHLRYDVINSTSLPYHKMAAFLVIRTDSSKYQHSLDGQYNKLVCNFLFGQYG